MTGLRANSIHSDTQLQSPTDYFRASPSVARVVILARIEGSGKVEIITLHY